MKTIVLHLERALDRRKHMLAEAEKHGLDFEIFPAFDCLGLHKSDYEQFCDMAAMEKYPDWLTPGMVCACYSHYLIYQKIISENLDMALVTEDDVVFSPNINEILTGIENSIKANEVILLHYMAFSEIPLSKTSAIDIGGGTSVYEGVNSFANANSAAGYVITREAAKTLSEFVLPVRYGTDCWRDFLEGGGIKAVRFAFPQPIEVVGFKSKATPSKNEQWNRITEFIDNNRIPGLFHLFRYLRLRSVRNRSRVAIK